MDEPFDGLDYFEEIPRDSTIDDAKNAVEQYFSKNPKSVLYTTQTEVLFEKAFFHWVTGKAIRELVENHKLTQSLVPLYPDKPAPRVKFIHLPALRYTKRIISRKLEIIRENSAEPVGRGCGRQAELLFSRALMNKKFNLLAESANEWNGRQWTETGHDLDYIFERDGLTYGCEIKNRFEYIDREEMDIKVEMCHFLGIIPLFIVRWAPKNYIEMVRESGGFTLLFQTHIYPYGCQKLVEDIRLEFIGLPVDCPRDIPTSIIERFFKWHQRRVEDG